MQPTGFQSFVVFAGMRTGSNFLEANLNALEGVICHGEAFNPHFIGYPNNDPILGVDLAAREADPLSLLDAIRQNKSVLGGFRYFHDHDPRVFDAITDDSTCAKIILTRNPVDSYVSWKIAQETGQWKLGDAKALKTGQAHFDAGEFQHHLEDAQAFQLTLQNRLQTSGQTAFYLSYEDLQSLDVLNGLARFLGVDARLEQLSQKLKKQNPASLSAKVRNYDQMEDALRRLDRFDLSRTPNVEPRRGPNVPSYVAAARSPLLYLPLRSSLQTQITDWLAALDGVAASDLQTRMTQKDLRQWKRRHPGHRSFSVLRHPVARAHDAFCRRILPVGLGSYLKLRKTLIKRYQLPLPSDGPNSNYDLAAHHAAFAAFLRFLKPNLAEQTSIRVDAAWCTQARAIAGFADFCLPDRLIREAELEEDLSALAASVGIDDVPPVPPASADQPFALAEVYDAEIEHLCKEAYQRDYMMFGFAPWRSDQAA